MSWTLLKFHIQNKVLNDTKQYTTIYTHYKTIKKIVIQLIVFFYSIYLDPTRKITRLRTEQSTDSCL